MLRSSIYLISSPGGRVREQLFLLFAPSPKNGTFCSASRIKMHWLLYSESVMAPAVQRVDATFSSDVEDCLLFASPFQTAADELYGGQMNFLTVRLVKFLDVSYLHTCGRSLVDMERLWSYATCTFGNGCFIILQCCVVFLYIYFSILGYLNSVAFLKVRDLCLNVCGVLNIRPVKVKERSSSKNKNDFIVYSSTCHSKPV